MKIRTVLIDDHQLVRAGIAALLRDLPDVDIVGEGADGQTALQLAESLQPDVMFLDLVMPGLSGLETLARLGQQHPQVKVIVLSMHASEEHVLRALRLGARGYVVKDVAPEELAHALKAVVAGNNWLSPAISRTVINSYLHRAAGNEGSEPLTPRQLEVLKLIAESLSTKEIAERLGLSIKTIETYRSQIMDRLEIHDVAGLVRYAIREGIIVA